MIRTPTETRTARMGPLARLPAFFALEGKRCVVAGGGTVGGVEGRAPFRRRRACRSVRARARRGRARTRRRAARRCGRRARAGLAAGRLRRRCACRRRVRRRRRSGAFCRRRAPSRRAGQRHRPAGILRFRLRRHRQPLAAGDRHFDRRRRPGVRPGDPRQDRGPDPERLRTLGGSRAHMASARPGAGAVVPRPAKFLGEIHRPRHCRSRPRAKRDRTEIVAGADRRAARPARSFSSAPARAIRSC